MGGHTPPSEAPVATAMHSHGVSVSPPDISLAARTSLTGSILKLAAYEFPEVVGDAAALADGLRAKASQSSAVTLTRAIC